MDAKAVSAHLNCILRQSDFFICRYTVAYGKHSLSYLEPKFCGKLPKALEQPHKQIAKFKI